MEFPYGWNEKGNNEGTNYYGKIDDSHLFGYKPKDDLNELKCHNGQVCK